AGIIGGGADGVVEIQLFLATGAGKLAQATQGQLDIADAELDGIIEVAVIAFFPDFYRGLVAQRPVQANAFRVGTKGTKRRGAAGADHLVAALVTLVLFLKTLAKLLEDFLQAAEALQLGQVFW